MSTIIDELIVRLGLDSKGFKQGEKEVKESVKKTKEEVRRGASEIEESASGAAGAIGRITTGFLAVSAAIGTLSGLKNFADRMAKISAETGRTATTLGMSTEAVSKWTNVAKLAGGEANDILGFFRNLNTEFEKVRQGFGSESLAGFRALGIDVIDQTTGKYKDQERVLKELAAIFPKLSASAAQFYGQQIGASDTLIRVLRQGPVALNAYLKDAEKLNAITKEGSEDAQEYERAWTKVGLAFDVISQKLANQLYPALTQVGNGLAKLLSNAADGTFIAPDSALGYLLGKGAGPGGAAPAGGGAGGLRVKAGAGSTSVGTAALANVLQNEVPGLNRFTAFNDDYHGGRGAHGRGQALDFSLKDPAQAKEVAEQIRKKLRDMGVDGTVLDEYNNPSSRATAGHIHVQFNSAAAAQKFGDMYGSGGGGSNVNATTNIGTINVQTGATDANGIAKSIGGALKQNPLAAQGNFAQN